MAEDRKEWQKLLRAGSHIPASQQITWMAQVKDTSLSLPNDTDGPSGSHYLTESRHVWT